jgi:hypothetical protein
MGLNKPAPQIIGAGHPTRLPARSELRLHDSLTGPEKLRRLLTPRRKRKTRELSPARFHFG